MRDAFVCLAEDIDRRRIDAGYRIQELEPSINRSIIPQPTSTVLYVRTCSTKITYSAYYYFGWRFHWVSPSRTGLYVPLETTKIIGAGSDLWIR